MTIRVIDGDQIHSKFDQLLKNFMPFAQKRLGYDKPVNVQLVSDPENAKDPLGKTAYYDPNLMRITLFIDKRHAKDILRSLSHELVHHKQNCEGKLSNIAAEEGYAQNDPHLREMEGEAYLHGSGFLLRDWEDNLKGDKQVYEDIMQEAWDRAGKKIKKDEAVLQESFDRAGKVINELADMPGVGPRGGEGELEAPDLSGMGGDPKVEDLKSELRTLDGMPKDEKLITAIAETAFRVLGGSLNESFKRSYKSLQKPLYSAHKSKESAKDVAKKIKKGLREDANWSRTGKDNQLFKELRKRWCK
tara:strand:- start:1419 stop:2327 length:909 start_codon:yes stop_codon:yes gene_type:complete